jgi:hypothetical protein
LVALAASGAQSALCIQRSRDCALSAFLSMI